MHTDASRNACDVLDDQVKTFVYRVRIHPNCKATVAIATNHSTSFMSAISTRTVTACSALVTSIRTGASDAATAIEHCPPTLPCQLAWLMAASRVPKEVHQSQNEKTRMAEANIVVSSSTAADYRTSRSFMYAMTIVMFYLCRRL